MLCTQDFWKSKEKPFLWLTQLKSSCHSNVRSQLSCFCFILNKLFLLRKMFFCLEVNWRQTFDPFVCSWGGTCCCSDRVCLEQEAGRPSISFWLSQCVNSEGSLVLLWPPFVCSEGDHLLLGPQRWWGNGAVCWHARSRGKHPKPHHNARVGGFAGLKSRSCWNLSFDLFCSPITFGLSFIFNLKKSLKLLYLVLNVCTKLPKEGEMLRLLLNVNDVNKAFPDTIEELLRLQGLLTRVMRDGFSSEWMKSSWELAFVIRTVTWYLCLIWPVVPHALDVHAPWRFHRYERTLRPCYFGW